ncbi:hypothetical protein C6497_16315 [Candidatus Poribacteria bacterium]|nr:MAG: hypothetical protein C6497_16315 [Candidatus Poribacteria bacterium]
MSIISHILLGKRSVKKPIKRTFLFFYKNRKLAVNIDGDRPNSDYTKIWVTEKSYDFVTFYINTENYLMTIQYILINLKNKNGITYTISLRKRCFDGLWECLLIGYSLIGYVIIMRYYHIENVLKMSVSEIPPKNIINKKEEGHKITQFKNFYNSFKTPMNPDCDRADSRFTNDTKCVKKCNIFNYINNTYNICET